MKRQDAWELLELVELETLVDALAFLDEDELAQEMRAEIKEEIKRR